MYAVIRQYQFDPSASEEVDRKVREHLVPRIKAIPGLVRTIGSIAVKAPAPRLACFKAAQGLRHRCVPPPILRSSTYIYPGITVSKPEILKGEVQAHA